MDSQTKAMFLMIAAFLTLFVFSIGVSFYIKKINQEAYETTVSTPTEKDEKANSQTESKDKFSIEFEDNALEIPKLPGIKLANEKSLQTTKYYLQFKDSSVKVVLSYLKDENYAFWGKPYKSLGKIMYKEYFLYTPYKANKTLIYAVGSKAPEKKCNAFMSKPKGDYVCFSNDFLLPGLNAQIVTSTEKLENLKALEIPQELVDSLSQARLKEAFKGLSFVLSLEGKQAVKYTTKIPYFCKAFEIPANATPKYVISCDDEDVMSFELNYDANAINVNPKDVVQFKGRLGNIQIVPLKEDSKNLKYIFTLETPVTTKGVCTTTIRSVNAPCTIDTFYYKENYTKITCYSKEHLDMCREIVSNLLIE